MSAVGYNSIISRSAWEPVNICDHCSCLPVWHADTKNTADTTDYHKLVIAIHMHCSGNSGFCLYGNTFFLWYNIIVGIIVLLISCVWDRQKGTSASNRQKGTSAWDRQTGTSGPRARVKVIDLRASVDPATASVKLQWLPPNDVLKGSPTIRYCIRFKPTSGHTVYTYRTVFAPETHLNIGRNLIEPLENYTFEVTIKNTIRSEWSAVNQFIGKYMCIMYRW